MKRTIILTVIITVMGLSSCTSFSSKTELKTEIDTLSYFWGLSRTDGVINYLTIQVGIDTIYLEDFYKGFRDGVKHYSPKDLAYLEGKRIAQMINNQWVTNLNNDIFMGDSGQTVNRKALLSGFYQGVKKHNETNTMQTQTYAQMLMEQVKENYRKEKYAEQIEASEKFLADNKNKPGVTTTASGLQYKIVTAGTGEIPDGKNKVKVNYRGTLVDGTEFDSSYKNNAPVSFRINGVIKGWSEALLMMPVGSKWELYIPSELAYGLAGQPPAIPPYATLIFEIELIEIEPN